MALKGWEKLNAASSDERAAALREDKLATAGIVVRVLVVFILFAVLWMLGADKVFADVLDLSGRPNFRRGVEFFGFIVLACMILGAALWSTTKSMIVAKRKLRESERELVRRLGQAAEWRDDETGDHTLRVGEYCAAIANGFGWRRAQCDDIRVAAMLHDIGKIGIPDFVMVKEGELSTEERQLIQAHTLMGSDILADSEVTLLQIAQKIAMSHHERWDGSGYPYGLTGSEIPIEGRIAALADVFDALTSRRRYKDAWTFDQAVEEVKSLSGTHFDPDVVTAFESALPAIRQIYDRFQGTARSFNISRAA